MNKDVKQKCFVIMPFYGSSEKHTEDYWTKHYEDFLKPLIESTHPLVAERSCPLRGDILRQIITDLVTTSIVVADLTDANPNVYWELGVRQSFKHGTITIAEDGTVLPFDLGVKGSLFYFPNDHIKMRAFEKQFNEAITDCLKKPDLPDSHVLETISGRGTLHQILARDESLRRLDAIISEIKKNKHVFKQIVEICNKNKGKIKKAKVEGAEASRSFVTARFRYMAASLLITSRYIAAEEAFYEEAERYVDQSITINDQLSSWQHNPELTESWLQKIEGKAKLCMDKFEEEVIRNKKTIAAIL